MVLTKENLLKFTNKNKKVSILKEILFLKFASQSNQHEWNTLYNIANSVSLISKNYIQQIDLIRLHFTETKVILQELNQHKQNCMRKVPDCLALNLSQRFWLDKCNSDTSKMAFGNENLVRKVPSSLMFDYVLQLTFAYLMEPF